MARNIVPINRMNKFFSGEDFNLEIEMGREFVEGDLNVTLILYRVDASNSSTDDLYGEAKKDEINFLQPVEIRVVPIINEPVNKAYNSNAGSGRYEEEAQFKFGIYESQLKEMNVDINFGDYIAYPVSETEMVYYSVVDNHVKNFNNKHTIYGFKGAFRTITCAAVNDNEFSGR